MDVVLMRLRCLSLTDGKGIRFLICLEGRLSNWDQGGWLGFMNL